MSKEAAFEIGRLYLPLKTIASTLTASQKDVFVRLPGLVAYYPMGIKFLSGAVAEHAGTAFSLAQVGLCPTGYDGNAFSHMGDGTNYFAASAPFDITGLETFISSSMRGLTIGGWFMFDAVPVASGGMITKDKISPERGWTMVYHSTEVVKFFVSGNGASTVNVDSASVSQGAWHFCVSRFTPSSEVAVFIDGDKNTNATSVPASLNVSAQDMEVGRQFNDNAQTLHGKARDVFICAAALSDDLIEEVRMSSVP